MRKLLDLCCLVLGGLSMVAGAGLLMLYWLGPASGIDPGKPVLLAGAAAVVLGAGIFIVARGGRTWPAWALMIALVSGTFALGQTADQWLPYVPTLADTSPCGLPDDSPNVMPVAGTTAQKTTTDKADAKTDAAAKTAEKAANPSAKADVAEGTEITPEQFITDHIEPALKAISAYEGYTASFHKQEWAKGLVGNNYRLTDDRISLKVRHEPFSAYLYFNSPKPGTEALYVEGQNDGKVVAHSTTFAGRLVGTIRVPPDDPKVMADNRYPITNIGMKNLMLKFKKESETHKEALKKDVSFTLVEDKKVDERPCKVIEIYNANPDKYPRASARLYLDREWNIPVGFESYEKLNGKVTLVEKYRYTNLKFNPGLKDIDFDPANPAYGYRR